MSLHVIDTDLLSLYQRGHPGLTAKVDAHPPAGSVDHSRYPLSASGHAKTQVVAPVPRRVPVPDDARVLPAVCASPRPETRGRGPPAAPVGSTAGDFASYFPYPSQHHSQTFPCMSNNPQPFGSLLPPEAVRLAWNTAYFRSISSSLPLANSVVVPARQEYSHSASVGRR